MKKKTIILMQATQSIFQWNSKFIPSINLHSGELNDASLLKAKSDDMDKTRLL